MKAPMLALLLLSLTWSGREGATCPGAHPTAEIVNALAHKLALEIGPTTDSYFFSPLSLSVCLAMVYQGAEGTTKHQMTTALKYRLADEEGGCAAQEVGKGFRDLLSAVHSGSDSSYKMLVANAAFVQKGLHVLPEFTSKLEKFFHSKVQQLDFAREARTSLDAVNGWVSNATGGRIANLLTDPLDPMTIMILMNAVYFKGLWLSPFDRQRTFRDKFYYPNGTSRVTPFMALQENVRYFHDKETEHSFLELEYAGQHTSMLIALPDRTDMRPLDLSGELLCRVRASLAVHDVIVVLPKFKLEYEKELSKIMINLGMTELFSDKADLTGIRPENDLHVSLLVHKAVLQVDEEGSTAAGVSGAGIDGRRRPAKQISFYAEHAFVFCLLDKGSGAILFLGRVADPRE